MPTNDRGEQFIAAHGAEAYEQLMAIGEAAWGGGGQPALENLTRLLPTFGVHLQGKSVKALRHWEMATGGGVASVLLAQYAMADRSSDRLEVTCLAGGVLDLESVRMGAEVRIGRAS